MSIWLLQVDPLKRFIDDVRIIGPILALGVLAIDLVIARFIALELRRLLKLPASLAWLYLVLSLIRCFLSPTSEVESILRVTASVSLSISVAYSGFTIIVDFMIGRNGKKPLRSLIRTVILVITFLGAALIGLRAGGITTVGVLASGAVVLGGAGAAVSQLVRQVGAGALLQYAKPFEVGDVLEVLPTSQRDTSRRGTVIHVHWSTTLLRGPDGIDFLVPNQDFVTNSILNFGHGDHAFRRDIDFSAAYDSPPHAIVKHVLNTIRTMPGVESEPAANVVVQAFHDSSVSYQLRYWTKRAEQLDDLDAEARMRIWYAFKRNRLSFPFPIRQLQWVSSSDISTPISNAIAYENVLKQSSLLSSLPDEEITKLVKQAREESYAAGETIVTMGDEGRAMYILLEGEASVLAPPHSQELLILKKGDFFGEMSLLTGDPRTATVVAVTPVHTLALDEPVFRALIVEFPQVAEILSNLLSARQNNANSEESQQSPNSTERQNRQRHILQTIKSLFGLSIF